MADVVFEQPPLHRLVGELQGRPGSWGRLICDVNLATASSVYEAARNAATQQGWAELDVSLQPTKIMWGVWARWGSEQATVAAPTLLRQVLPAPPQPAPTPAQLVATEHPLGTISATMGMWRRAKVRRLDRDHARLAGYYTLAVRAFGKRAVNELHHWLSPNYDRDGLSASVTKLRKMGLLTEAMALRKPGGDLTPKAIALLTPAERERFHVTMPPRPPTPPTPEPEPSPGPAPIALAPTTAQLADIAAINAENAALVARTRKERTSSGSCEISPSGMAEYLRPAARAAVAAGWDITLQGNGHLSWRGPDGARVVTPLTGQTQGSAPRNVMAELRRAGAPV